MGVSLKMYFGHREAVRWFDRVAELARTHDAVARGAVEFFVIPTYPQLLPAVAAFAGTPVRIGAQDVAAADSGPFTGEVSAVELVEIGVSIAEIGHAERRRLFHETDEVVAAKTAAALRNDLTPVLCVGETARLSPRYAAADTVAQLRRSPRRGARRPRHRRLRAGVGDRRTAPGTRRAHHRGRAGAARGTRARCRTAPAVP